MRDVACFVGVASHFLYSEKSEPKLYLVLHEFSKPLQHITYQYARKGARLVLVARREGLLKEVADRAVTKGASDVKVIIGDVTKESECKLFVDETVHKYGRCKTTQLSFFGPHI